jgi:hypothetical protein
MDQGKTLDWLLSYLPSTLRDLTPADLLGIIADCVARLPRPDDEQRPALELGEGDEMYTLIAERVAAKQAEGFCDEGMVRTGTPYACVLVDELLWVGASKLRAEVAK